MFCKYCGSKLNVGNDKCPNCGKENLQEDICGGYRGLVKGIPWPGVISEEKIDDKNDNDSQESSISDSKTDVLTGETTDVLINLNNRKTSSNKNDMNNARRRRIFYAGLSLASVVFIVFFVLGVITVKSWKMKKQSDSIRQNEISSQKTDDLSRNLSTEKNSTESTTQKKTIEKKTEQKSTTEQKSVRKSSTPTDASASDASETDATETDASKTDADKGQKKQMHDE